MDAIVTISLMTGKQSVGTIEKAVKLPTEVESALSADPEKAAQWILSNAYSQSFNGVEIVLPAAAPIQAATKRGR